MLNFQCTSKNHREQRALIMGLTAITFWSVGAVLCCVLKHVPLLQILAISQLVGAVVSLALEGKPVSFNCLWERLTQNWICVALLMTNQLAYTFAFRAAPPAHVDLINYTWPVLLVLGEAVRVRRGLFAYQWVGVALGFLGIATLVGPDLVHSRIEAAFLPGYLAALTAGMAWVGYCLIGKQQAENQDAHASSGQDILLTGVIYSLFCTSSGCWQPLGPVEWISLLFLGICVYGLAFPMWRWALNMGNHNAVSSLANLIPVLSVFLLVLGGYVAASWQLLEASVFIAIGCGLLNSKRMAELARVRKVQVTS